MVYISEPAVKSHVDLVCDLMIRRRLIMFFPKILGEKLYQIRNTGINVCQSLLLVHLIECGGPYTVMFYNTKLLFDNQVSCLIRGWRFNQVSSLKYFSSGAIAPVHCTGAGACATLLFRCMLHIMSRR